MSHLPRLLLPLLAAALYQYGYSDPALSARRKASNLFTMGKLHAARREYERALTLLPDEGADTERVAIHTQLGVCLVSLGKRAEAAERFEAALAIDPTHSAARKLLAGQQRILQASGASGASGASRDTLRKAIETDPSDPFTYTSLAHSLHRDGHLTQALAALRHAIAISPSDDGRDATHHNAGVLQLVLGHTGDAVASFEAATSINPRNLAAQLMRTVTRPRDDQQAATQLRRALESFESSLGQPSADAAAASGPEMAHYATVARSLLAFTPASQPSPSPPTPLGASLVEGLRTRGYAVIDNALGPYTLRDLRSAWTELEWMMRAGATGAPGGVQPMQRARSDMVVRLPNGGGADHQLSRPLRDGLGALRTLLVRDVYPSLLVLRPSSLPPLWPREELQLACYEHGGYYSPHEDERSGGVERGADGGGEDGSGAEAGGEATLARSYTAIYYATDPDAPWADEASGGALRLWPRGSYEAIVLPPKADRLVVFDATLTHEVMLVRLAAGRRCAFTQWFSAVQHRTRAA